MSNLDFTEVSKILEYCRETGMFKWKVRVNSKVPSGATAGTPQNNGYILITINSKKYLAHRLAWFMEHGEFPNGQIDHINGNRIDNRIANLRVVTTSENQHNQRSPRGNNPYLGVSVVKGTRYWQAHIAANGKQKNLGRFKTPEEARDAYIEAKKIWHPTAPHLTAS
jgi:hypothetical protein